MKKFVIMWQNEGCIMGFNMDKSKRNTPHEFDTKEDALAFIKKNANMFMQTKVFITQLDPVTFDVSVSVE